MATITASPGQTIHIRQIDAGIRQLQYKIDSGSWSSSLSLPVTFVNSDASSGNIFVTFDSDIIVDQSSVRFIVGSNGIQIGSRTLNPDGTRYLFAVSGITNYDGLVENHGYNDISIYNLLVIAINGSTLASGAGWVGGYSYGTDGTNNYIFYCESDGPISQNSGGIVGAESCSVNVASSADLTLVGCSSSGAIDTEGGGIAGHYLGQAGGSVTFLKCWSTGTIGTGGGGITGSLAAQGGGTVTADRCYSTGIIGTNAGGIFGTQSANDSGSATATYCYSRGFLQGSNSGGIFGSGPAINSGTATATRCYSTGTINPFGGGIVGVLGAPTGTVAVTNCYVAGSTLASTGYIIALDNTQSFTNYSESFNGGSGWNDTNAGQTMGTSEYVSIALNQPYFLKNFGPSPYSLETVLDGGEDLTQSYSETIPGGLSGLPASVAGYSTFLLANNTGGIVINPTTGAITAPVYNPVKPTFTFEVVATNGGGYSVTTFVLTVIPGPSPAPTVALLGKGSDFSVYTDLQIGKRLVQERLENTNIRFKSFEDYHKYKMALLKK